MQSEAVNVRMIDTLLAQLDTWAASQGDRPTRPESIRRLIQIALGREAGKP